MAKKNAANVVGVKTKTTWKQAFKRDWQLYLLLLLPLIMVFVFSYGAYPGLRMAFMDYKPAKLESSIISAEMAKESFQVS